MVGTTTPQNKLNVIGDINFTGLIFGNGSQLTDITTTETDPLWTANQSSYFTSAQILGFSYYNSSDFSIGDYSTTASIFGFNYWNDTQATFNKTYADTLYYAISNPFSFWNDTQATFNKTYADTLYSGITEPLWAGNETNVAFKNEANVFTAGQNLTGQNITAIDCIIFDSGGKICSGV